MSSLYNFKKNYLFKKADKKPDNRVIKILDIKKIHSVLIIIEKDADIEPTKRLVKKTFENSKITCLSLRPQKEDLSSNYDFHFHPSDLGFGKIKNDRLIGLLNSNFDISVDFVTKSNDLNYFVKKCNASLKIGNLHSSKNYLYDLLVEKGKTNADFLTNIETQLKILGSNEH
jgi:hypothetical protein